MTPTCPSCGSSPEQHSKFGHFQRKSDKKLLKRFLCKRCGKTFSQATFQLCYRQKKRKLNPIIRKHLVSGVSQRRIARLLKISRTTVARKFLFLAQVARMENLKDFLKGPMVRELQFDDLETMEHTKCKPLSVTMAVEKGARRILGFQVSRMPAKGLLAKASREKYGFRKDERTKGLNQLFFNISPKVHQGALIESDKNPHYSKPVKRWFPSAKHVTTEGLRGCIVGQGELKKAGFDPLFSLNHSFAMLRANINRLFRKTWCTTKVPARLSDHIEIYVNYHNRVLLQKKV